jgi:hypothetical protein
MFHAVASSSQFCGATDKSKAALFWGTNQETVAVILRSKSPSRRCQFLGPNRKTLHHLDFEAQPRNHRRQFWGQTRETVVTGFEAKLEKTVPVVLRPNHWQTVDLDFKAQPRSLHSSSPRARCRLHTVPPDLLISRLSSTKPVRPSSILCTRSPTPDMVLIAACHAAPASCTQRDKQTRFFKQTKDKGKTNESCRIRIQTSPSQWLFTIKPRNWSLDFSTCVRGWVVVYVWISVSILCV